MKHNIRTARNILALMMAVLMVALTASVAAFAASVDVVVEFVNEYATDSIDQFTDLTHYKTNVETMISVPAGTLIYDNAEGAPEGAVVFDKVPTRLKDEAYGAYDFAGWVLRDGETETPAVFPLEVNEDTVLYATFTGKAVTYTIDFRSDGVYVDAEGNLQPDFIEKPVIDEATGQQMTDPYNGKPLFETVMNDAPRPAFQVEHGGSVTPPSKNPTRADVDHYQFVFRNWDYDYTHIYKSGSIGAVYDMVGKTYKFKFCDYDGTELGEREIVYGEACEDVPEVPKKQFSTNESQYSFHGDWNLVQDGLQSGTGEMIDMTNLKFTDAVADEDGYIKVYAQYWQQLNEYFFTLHIIDPDGDAAADVGVQVAGPENQLLNTFRDEALGHNGGVGTTNDDGIVTLSVPYAEYYTVSAYDPYYNLATQVRLTLDDIKDEAQITLQLKEPYDLNKGQQYCNDICHTAFGGLWITGLNLFYRLFKVKYVCCYDMYAVHGSRLAYAAGSSGRTIDRS